VASDLVTDAAAELYGTDPQEFTDRRKALAAAARAAGDTVAARQIAALRKPTRAAWVLNRLARAAPDAPARLADLAAAMRGAQRAKDGRRLRELSARRGDLIDDLTDRALAAAGAGDRPAGLREDVATTLTAALTDPEVADQFASGTLTRAAQWAGFGAPPPAGEGEAEEREAGEGEAGEEPAAAPGKQAAPLEEPARRTVPARKPRGAEDEEKRAARQRRAIEDAERAVATASANAADAEAAEERLEATVRDLEQRLTQARAQLADARLRARRAEAAERKARQTLGHLRG
jgi:hypothetical protein